MASLTIRKLDDAIRAELLLCAARNGCSVEDEVRGILREASRDRSSPAAPASLDVPATHQARAAAAGLARVTLIIGGGIAAYKALDLIRRLKERHVDVRCVLTKAAQQFVTALSVSALSHGRCYTDLFDPESEFDAGHIRLARDCDLIVVAPATADLMAKMEQGPPAPRPDGKSGTGPPRRSCQPLFAGGPPADSAGAGDKPADVKSRRDPP